MACLLMMSLDIRVMPPAEYIRSEGVVGKSYLPKSPLSALPATGVLAGFGTDFMSNHAFGRGTVAVPVAWIDALAPHARVIFQAVRLRNRMRTGKADFSGQHCVESILYLMVASVYTERVAHGLEASVRFAQSNLTFLTAINAEFGHTGYISTRSAAANMNEGRYSQGELRQMLTFMGKAAGDVAAELQPYTVTKAPHIEILLDMLKHPAGPSGLSARQQCHHRMQDLYSKAPDDSALVAKISRLGG
ncbi:TPA: hypothetical protein ACH3X1_006053 [Trebouxia sp. C0004]